MNDHSFRKFAFDNDHTTKLPRIKGLDTAVNTCCFGHTAPLGASRQFPAFTPDQANEMTIEEAEQILLKVRWLKELFPEALRPVTTARGSDRQRRTGLALWPLI